MTAREKLEAEDKKLDIFIKRCATCETCGKRLLYTESQLAHRIPKSKMYLKKYGKEIIHHTKNLALVCGLECNSAVNISNNPMAVVELVKEIQDSFSLTV